MGYNSAGWSDCTFRKGSSNKRYMSALSYIQVNLPRAGPLRFPTQVLHRQSAKATCSASAFGKQTCIFRNVCFLWRRDVPTGGWSINVTQPQTYNYISSSQAETAQVDVLLRKHLDRVTEGTSIRLQYGVNITDMASLPLTDDASFNLNKSISLEVEHAVTLLWRVGGLQESFGHALINQAYPMFLALTDQLGEEPPQYLQVLVTPEQWQGPVLPHVLSNMVSQRMRLLANYFQGVRERGKDGVCFRTLLLGDGGYAAASWASLANSGQQERHTYATGPSMFSSRNWWSFRRHAMQVAGVVQDKPNSRPLILLNDKRYRDAPGSSVLQDDRRMILDIEQLANDIRQAYPHTDVIPVRFRELAWPDQLRLLSTSTVFITTQGSSAFRLVFLPLGSSCIMVGSPELPGEQEWQSFHELDRWFPLNYVRLERYPIPYSNTSDEFVVWRKPGHWEPGGQEAARRWWLYNAHVRLHLARLKPMLDRALLV
eukprot:GHUV01054984.1.p1 GENE.GHUV01054984.1~~GHUV01054984.1.p1  ORF type:complete len:485 (+),score=44.64 GHUV01054984.1:527-1981(+)